MKRLLLYLVLIFCHPVFAQVDESSELYRALKTNDSLLFEIGFNHTDTLPFSALLSDTFEFYHDEAGMMLSKGAFIQSVYSLSKLSYRPKRVLVANSLQVYPLKKNGTVYGAIQTGEHRFYAIEKNKPEYLTSTALFTNVWILEHNQWKLKRALSYNHKLPDTDTIHQKTFTGTINETLLFKDRVETDKWLMKYRIPALGIGYIKNGKMEETTVYGKNEQGKENPVNTIFNVASLTKPVTAMVALKLINAGKLGLDEPLFTYWTDPDVVDDPRSKKLTIRHILSHQSGFPNWRDKTPTGKLAFEFEPGTKYQYSGEGFEYLRMALEHKFNKPLDQLAKELIFEPLKMHDTHFYWDSTVDETRFANWHKGDGSRHTTYKNTTPNAADDLLTTVEDYSKFMAHVMNGAGLSKDLYQQMISMQVRIKPRKYWGLSWWVDEQVNGNENVLINGGDDKGVHTIVFILPDSKEGLLIFTNCDNGTDIYIPVVEHYLGNTGKEIIDIETKP